MGLPVQGTRSASIEHCKLLSQKEASPQQDCPHQQI